MCQVYNSVGSLTVIKSRLSRYNVTDFNSVRELIVFRKSYSSRKQEIICEHEQKIQLEKQDLHLEITTLNEAIENKKTETANFYQAHMDGIKKQVLEIESEHRTNLFKRIRSFFTLRKLQKEIRKKESSLDSDVEYSIQFLMETRNEKLARFTQIDSNFSNEVEKSCRKILIELERKKKIVDDLNSFIYGALGEQNVVNELTKLSDDFHLINDFCLSFSDPIYFHEENEYIKSVQIDHVLISQSGVFIIETKNWNEKSLENVNLHSPIHQIRRTSFVMYKILTHQIANHKLILSQHHWGTRRIPIRNIIVLINSKPTVEFQYAKVLTISELRGYIEYFKPTFSKLETEQITHYLKKYSAINKWHNS